MIGGNKGKHYPVVTVITPTYNHRNYIAQCIESVLGQTYLHWEQLIIDDGSTDGTDSIVKRYKDPRITYIRQEHNGILKLASTYNRALASSSGELIAILEGDDFWPPDKLERQVVAFSEPDIVLTWGIGLYVNIEGKLIGQSKPFSQEIIFGKQAVRKLCVRNFVTPTVTVMVRKAALLPEGFRQPPGVPYVDYPTWFFVARKGKFKFLNEVLGYWRLHSEQTSRRLWDMRKGELLVYLDLWRNSVVSLPLFAGLVLWSLGKHLRRFLIGMEKL